MSIASQIVDDIRDHVQNYELNRSQAEDKENLVSGFRYAPQTKSVKYQLREAQEYLTIYETNAANSRQEAMKIYTKYKEYFDSDELREAEELIGKL
ncbi:hypothetical protein NSS64_29060 [Paenibacillus sp. FSL H8-0122]|uniref:hypothetical protein n=1 Tax=Paenibacillus sp. FSL H8-0122 TaxID=2954510 RepID=UPI0030F9DDFD